MLPPATTTVTPARASQNSEYTNGPLRAAGAFSIATALVGVSAWATVIGVKSYMQVKTVRQCYIQSDAFTSKRLFWYQVDEFAIRMRTLIREQLPVFSARLHRPLESADHGLTADPEDGEIQFAFTSSTSDSEQQPWTREGFERRLSEAYDKGGLSTWFSQLVQELEREGELERRPRK